MDSRGATAPGLRSAKDSGRREEFIPEGYRRLCGGAFLAFNKFRHREHFVWSHVLIARSLSYEERRSPPAFALEALSQRELTLLPLTLASYLVCNED